MHNVSLKIRKYKIKIFKCYFNIFSAIFHIAPVTSGAGHYRWERMEMVG